MIMTNLKMVCIGRLVGFSLRAKSSVNGKSVSVMSLDFTWSILKLKSLPPTQYLKENDDGPRNYNSQILWYSSPFTFGISRPA